VIGYILLNIGIIMGAISVIFNLIYNIILKFDPGAFYAGVLIGTGLAWLLFIIPGSIIVRKHEQLLKTIIGAIITLFGVLLSLGIIAIEVTVSSAKNINFYLVLFYLPFVLFYLNPGIYVGAYLTPDNSWRIFVVLPWLYFTFLFTILIILSSIMVIKHKFFVKKLFAVIVILLGIIPQIVVFVDLLAKRLRESARPIGRAVGPEPELRLEPLFRPDDLLFFLIFFLSHSCFT
jgi:hypothetical protein